MPALTASRIGAFQFEIWTYCVMRSYVFLKENNTFFIVRTSHFGQLTYVLVRKDSFRATYAYGEGEGARKKKIDMGYTSEIARMGIIFRGICAMGIQRHNHAFHVFINLLFAIKIKEKALPLFYVRMPRSSSSAGGVAA